MDYEWRYLEDGEVLGPLSTADIRRRLATADDQPHFVWKEGMVDWIDARELPQFSAPSPADDPAHAARRAPIAENRERRMEHKSLGQRARHELIAYLAVSGYLLIWFSAVMFYKSTILGSVGIHFAPFGLAAVKALILGKFILVLEALRLGERGKGSRVLALDILREALLFTLVLIVLSIVEELIVGHFHGREAREAIAEIGGGTIPQAIATSILMFLVLLPYLAFRRLALMHGALPELLFKRREFNSDSGRL
jgi:hypothetical protein